MRKQKNKNWVLTVLGYTTVAMSLIHNPASQAQDFQTVTNLAELEALVDQPWTNASAIIPPGSFTYRTDLGVLLYPDGFPSDFLAGLIPATNAGFEMFPVYVVETNTMPRQRLYLSVADVAAYTTTVSLASYPSNCIVANYGAAPSYLDATNRNLWFDERDPMRQRVHFTLLAQSNAAAYYAALTNAVVVTLEETNTFSMLDAYSNDIAFVKTGARDDGAFEYYLHAPPSVSLLDVYASTNLLAPLGGWFAPMRIRHASDPLCVTDFQRLPTAFFAAGNPVVDTDGDGIPDCMEQRLYGTDPGLCDTDGDGLTDGEELLRWGCNPLLVSSDGSILLDGQKIALGLNPSTPDTDCDGASDATEVVISFTNPLDPDSDDDGMQDGAEIANRTYPGVIDTDADGLTDKQEDDLGTDPLLADSDGDDIDDDYEHGVAGWDPLDPANAPADDDGDGLSNLQEYQWCYSPVVSNTHDYVQRLIVKPAGINGIRSISDSTHYRHLATGNAATSARLWVRPFKPGSGLAAQRLYHSGTLGFYINGVAASGVSSPITIPAAPTNTEFVITSDATAWGTNIQFQLKTTNDYQGLYCSATFYSPKFTTATFAMSSSTNYSTVASDNYTNVSFGTTGVIAYCVADDNEMPRIFVYPYQYPSQGYGIPFFTFTDWARIGFSGTYSGTCTTNTMNARDFRSVYGVAGNTRVAGGAFFSGGQYLARAGFDMDGDGVVDDAEVQESCKVTVFRTVFEPVTTQPQSNPVYNPSGIKVGGTATYHIDVYPASIPDSEIVWSCTNASISFPNGNTGRTVSVGASAQGMAKLKVDIAGYKKTPPTIWVKGLSNTTVNITFFIICDENGVPAVTPDFVTNSLARANDIYSQASMTFMQQGAIHYITNQDWTVVEKGTFPPYWDECYEITSFTNGTGGLEVYFVKEIQDARGLSESSGRGNLVSSLGNINVLAHEIGHACGLKDIYIDRPGITVGTNLTCSAWLPQDWNNGPSPLYYETFTKQEWIISCLLMHGVESWSATRDLPMGNVYGIKISTGTNYTTGLTRVGIDNDGYPMNRNPISY